MNRNKGEKVPGKQILISTDAENRRIDNYLFNELKGVPRSRIYQMLRKGEVRVNGGRKRPSYKLNLGDKVRIPPLRPVEPNNRLTPPGSYLEKMVMGCFLYEDDELVVLNKPSGIVVHGGSGRSWGIIELLRMLRSDAESWQLVHRLDRETSGCLLIAKKMPVLRMLHEALVSGGVEKQYLSLLKGNLSGKIKEIHEPLASNRSRSGERMVEVNNLGKSAVTLLEKVRDYPEATLVRVRLQTGRTHQIRVHAGHLGHPVAGDDKYGDREFNRRMRKMGLRRIFLHASLLRLPRMEFLVRTEFSAPLPTVLQQVLDALDPCKG